MYIVYLTTKVTISCNTIFVSNFLLVIMKCQFDSYPPPVIRWIKIVEERDQSQMILEDNHPQVIEISTKQIGSTFYETQLTVNLFS